MEMDLKNIIEKIKQEGVGEAEKQAETIVSRAEEKAGEIVRAACQEKEALEKRGKDEAEKLRKHAVEAMDQAARDVVLSLKEKIIELFDGILEEDVGKAMTTEAMSAMIVGLLEKTGGEKDVPIEVLVNEKDKDDLEKLLTGQLKDRMKKGITVKVSPTIENGFRIGESGENNYYDLSDEAVSEAFKTFLNPRIAKLLDAGE